MLQYSVSPQPLTLRHGRVDLRPLEHLKKEDWQRVQRHFRDKEIAHLNGSTPSRMPLWLLRHILKVDARRHDRETFGIFDLTSAPPNYIGTVELYDLTPKSATLGIIIGERTHWNRGFGREAIHAILSHAFHNLGLKLVRLHTFGDNVRAQRSFTSVGFVEVKRYANRWGREDVMMELHASTWVKLCEQPPAWHQAYHSQQ